jgi:hypothetical protein
MVLFNDMVLMLAGLHLRLFNIFGMWYVCYVTNNSKFVNTIEIS